MGEKRYLERFVPNTCTVFLCLVTSTFIILSFPLLFPLLPTLVTFYPTFLPYSSTFLMFPSRFLSGYYIVAYCYYNTIDHCFKNSDSLRAICIILEFPLLLPHIYENITYFSWGKFLFLWPQIRRLGV